MNPNQTSTGAEEQKINIDEEMESIKADMQARFGLLPEELQQAIMSNEYQMKLYDIAKKYKLTYEQLGKLEMETTLVLLGMTHPDEYGMEIQRAIKTTPEILQNVIKEVGEQVFVPIRTTLMKLYTEDDESSVQPIKVTESVSTEPLARKMLVNNVQSIPQTTPQTTVQPKATPIAQATIQSMQPAITPTAPKTIQQTPVIPKTGALEAYTQVRQQTYSPTPVTESKPLQANTMAVPQAPYKQTGETTAPPQTAPGISITQVANKLQNTVVTNPTVRTYTTPPVATSTTSAQTPQQKSQTGDLYREPLE